MTKARAQGGFLPALLGLLVTAAMVQPVWANSEAPLKVDEVLASSRTHFPTILASIAERREAQAKYLEAQGAFDTFMSADGLGRVSGFYNGTVVRTEAKRALRPMGAEIYAGYMLSENDFPIYEDRFFTNTGGELKAGALFSLLRNNKIDERRFGEVSALLDIREADFELLLTRVEVQQRALMAYWQWVARGRQLAVYEQLLSIALDRADGLKEQVRRGAQAEIFLVENQQNITRRQGLVRRSERDFQQAANSLSYYLRDQSGAPRVPLSTQLPKTDDASEDQDPASLAPGAASTALALRPELQILRTALERAEQQIALAENDLRPQLDLKFEIDHDIGAIAEGGRSRDSTDTILGFTFSVPLERRQARGKLRQRQAQEEAIRYRTQLKEEQIEIELRNILTELRAAHALYELAQQEVQQSEQLRSAEQRRFESGASDFFLVNLREETAANAQIKLYVAEMNRRIARAQYDAATVDLNRLGLSEAGP